MNREEIIDWLVEGDVAIQYQVHRDLLGITREDLQERIAIEGWGKAFLAKQKFDGHWGRSYYQPKWISTHYTLLDLRNLCLPSKNQGVVGIVKRVAQELKATDGGIRLGPSTSHRSDICVNGMFLNIASYFRVDETLLYSVVDSILDEIMPDGGFNCRSTRSGAKHSSLHSTISVLEGLQEFVTSGCDYREAEIRNAIRSAEEFILVHRLYRSDKTGKIIHPNFLKFVYPYRWRYDVLRALDYFQYVRRCYDVRMKDALHHLLKKRNNEGTWNVNASYAGQTHFIMEKAGKPSRWNTLRAIRVLDWYKDSLVLSPERKKLSRFT